MKWFWQIYVFFCTPVVFTLLRFWQTRSGCNGEAASSRLCRIALACGTAVQAAGSRFPVRAAEPPANLRRMAAFTLVEVALAILAIGLGLLGIFGLGHYGLEATRETANDERCDQFADAVFSTLRSYNEYFSAIASSNGVNAAAVWHAEWAQAVNDELDFPPVAGINTNVTKLAFNKRIAAFDPNNLSLLEWNPYYALGVLTNAYSTVAGGYNYLGFALMIYPDGNTYSSAARSYTTSLTFTGGMP